MMSKNIPKPNDILESKKRAASINATMENGQYTERPHMMAAMANAITIQCRSVWPFVLMNVSSWQWERREVAVVAARQ